MPKFVRYSSPSELERARVSREWTSERDAKKQRKKEARLAKLSRIELAERTQRYAPPVKVLPPGPQWAPRLSRRQARANEIGRLRGEVKRLEELVDKIQRTQVRADFYDSPAWHKARYAALKRSNGCCELCGESKATGAIMQVDHIKPRSLHPELELELSNLQVLCRACNMGKSNKDQIDWRKPELKVVRGD